MTGWAITLRSQIESYIRDGLLPYVADRAFDPLLGGFNEFLTEDGPLVPSDFRRVTICGRNMFVFATAFGLGDFADGAAIARACFDDLTTRFFDDHFGGVIFSINHDGSPHDRDKDLYGTAFALFGLAEMRRHLDHRAADPWLARLDGILSRYFLLPSGWYSAKASTDWQTRDHRLFQNPHMHLLEASVAAYRATGAAVHKSRILELMHLFETRLLDPKSHAIGEFKDEAGNPTPDEGHIVEPGHHFEWAWLIGEAAQVLDRPDWHGIADRAFDFGLSFGIDPVHGGVFDAVAPDGSIVRDTKRIWPLTEYIKAEAVRVVGPDPKAAQRAQAALKQALEFFFAHYLLPNGGWRERLTRDLVCYDARMPASTPYHIYLALIQARMALDKLITA